MTRCSKFTMLTKMDSQFGHQKLYMQHVILNIILIKCYKCMFFVYPYIIYISFQDRFQMDQLSCPHAIVVLQKVNDDPYNFFSSCYTKQAIITSYKELVYPVGKKDT